jgi:hypothetical protein
MAKFIASSEAEPTYTMEFTQSELRLIADAFGDIAEGRCHLAYPDEGAKTATKPTAGSIKKIQAICAAIDGVSDVFDASSDFFDRWENHVD